VKKWGGLLALVLIVVGIIFWHNRLGTDFWPLDRSTIGPNLVASVVQWAIIALVVYLAYPPVRRALDRWAKSHVHEANVELHKKLDESIKLSRHIIHHTKAIPNEDRDGNLLIVPEEKP
jgi:hypothetical protein